MICIGIGLGIMFYQQNQGLRSVWIGAFIALIGVASFVNALFDERDATRHHPPETLTPNP